MALHFSCTGCGRCCHLPTGSSLVLDPVEALAYAEKFPLTVAMLVMDYRVVKEATLKMGASDREAENLIKSSYVVKVSGSPTERLKVVVGASLNVVPTHQSQCPALDGKVCSMYEERPLACRAFPISMDTPLRVTESVSRHTLAAHIKERGYGCDVEPSAPVLILGTPPTEIQAGILEYRRRQVAFTSHLLRSSEFTDAISSVMPSVREEGGREATFSVLSWLSWLLASGQIALARAVSIFHVQHDMLIKWMGESRLSSVDQMKIDVHAALLGQYQAEARDLYARLAI